MNATRSRGMSASAWARRTEQQSLALDSGLLKLAKDNTRAAMGDTAFLMRIATELCETRARELTLAYRNLIQLMPGFRQRQVNDRRLTIDEVCVLCIVRRKVHISDGRPGRLPQCLLVYAEHNGQRKVFAIPTDVQEASEYSVCKAHRKGHIWVQNTRLPATMGHYACMVNLLSDTSQLRCILSAQHVLTPYPNDGSFGAQADLMVCPDLENNIDQARVLAASLAYGGLLRSDERPDRPSFDVQLARIANDAEVRARTALRRLNKQTPYFQSLEQLYKLENNFSMMVPSRGSGNYFEEIPCRLGAFPTSPVPLEYSFAGTNWEEIKTVYHTGLISFNCSASDAPRHGDSGSAVLLNHPDKTQTLVGMLIGGKPGKAWIIPAWQLMDLANWLQYPSGARLELLEP